MQRLFLILLIALGSCSNALSQDLEYARKLIDTLTAPYFAGRGAVDDGERKAADFLRKEFKKLGLQAYQDDYFQEFRYPINTFPGKLSVNIDGKELVPGVDYLVGAASGSVGGTYELICYNKSNAPTKKQLKRLTSIRFFANKFIVISEEGQTDDEETFELLKLNVFGAAGVIFLQENKLTHRLSPTYQDYGILHVKADKIDKKSRKITLEIDQKFMPNQLSQNVIGYVKGTEYPDSVIMLTAHYDHLGKMGDNVYFPGANDNASGTAMLLNLAYHYTHKEPPKKTIVFAAFGAEEAGILGSKYFVQHPTVSLSRINFVMNMDLLGTGGEGATIVNGAILPYYYDLLQKINEQHNYLVEIKKRGKAQNSDHYWFTENGVPAFFIYLRGGIKAYHDVEDVSKTLPLTEFEDSFRLIRDFVDEL